MQTKYALVLREEIFKSLEEEKMNYKAWYDEENGILRADILKKFEPEDTKGLMNVVNNEFTDEQRRYLLLTMFEDAQVMPSKETRKAMREAASLVKLSKIAMCGAKPTVRMLGKIVIAAMGKTEDSKFFATEEEALAWLKAEKEKESKESK